jgi:hypothetical protein
MSNSESADFRVFAKRLLLFSLPIFAYMAVVFLCDPFQVLGGPPVISEAVKLRSANPLNTCLWKMAKFHRDPKPNLLLGDSRMGEVPVERVSEITHESYANMAYGGASLRECIETFWFANRQMPLRKVYFGMSFDLYNDYNIVDRTESYIDMAQNPALYFISRTVFQATAFSIYSAAFNADLKIGAPEMSREAFWDYTINGPQTTRLFKTYLYPVKYHAQLVEIGRYAKEHGIQLTFVVFPTHTDFQARFDAFGMQQQKQRICQDLSAIATVFDFDYPNALTSDAGNFADPLHLTAPAVDEVVDEVWGNRVTYARKY